MTRIRLRIDRLELPQADRAAAMAFARALAQGLAADPAAASSLRNRQIEAPNTRRGPAASGAALAARLIGKASG